MRLLLALAMVAALAAPANAQRIAYYRLGAAVVDPGSLDLPHGPEAGFGWNAGVSVPFQHRMALTLDVAQDRWEDRSLTTGLIGVDVAFRRGGVVRPLLSFGIGAASLESHSVFASSAAAGVRIRLPGEHRAIRVQVGWTGLSREDFASVVPVRAQLEF